MIQYPTSEEITALIHFAAARRIEHAENLLSLWKQELYHTRAINYQIRLLRDSETEWRGLKQRYGDQFSFDTIEQEVKDNRRNTLIEELNILLSLDSSSAKDMVTKRIRTLEQ